MSASRLSECPVVSIVVPVYNLAPYIAATLASVAGQTYPHYEAIVINDGSTDDTEEALRPFRTHVVYVRQEHRGVGAARNAGLCVARGRYVALLDGDDILMPNYLERMVTRLAADPQIDVFYPNAILFGSPRWEGKLFQDLYPSREPVTFERLLTRQCTIFVAATFRRELLDRVGLFDETLREGCEDLDLWLRMARQGVRFAFTTEPLVRYRQRIGSLSTNEVRMTELRLRVYEHLLAAPDATPRERDLIRPIIGRLRARHSLAVSKQMILAKDFAGASHQLALARTQFRGPRLAAAALALRLAPNLVARWMVRQRRQALRNGSTPS